MPWILLACGGVVSISQALLDCLSGVFLVGFGSGEGSGEFLAHVSSLKGSGSTVAIPAAREVPDKFTPSVCEMKKSRTLN